VISAAMGAIWKGSESNPPDRTIAAMKSATSLGHLHKRLIVPPGKKINLRRDYDPGFKDSSLVKRAAPARLRQGVQKLAEYQDKLYAQDRYALLIIFQAMDAAGKDGVIKHVMSGINPQGCQVYSFKAPSAEELDHDFLWRCAKNLPERGRIGIFNRSYYEEVLVVRVHPEYLHRQHLPEECIDADIWQRRFEHINNFERYLVENGIAILKFFLNVSKQEQKKRFLDRINESDKNWKFNEGDVMERQHWNHYMDAYEECLRHTSTRWAPWYVIPADAKWFTRLAVADVITARMQELKLEYPTISAEQRAHLAEARRMLLSEPD
jgi:PPK2 family polyphosphate:nucleotide phosphotransferase